MHPLAPLQQGMLFQSLLSGEGGGGFDIEQLTLELDSLLDKRALETAFAYLLSRHPALTASFHSAPGGMAQHRGEGEPYQTFHTHLRVTVGSATLAAPDYPGQQREFEEFLAADRQVGFDLTKPPLMRASLVERVGQRPILLWTFHHILMDGRSIARFLYELFEAYDAHLENREVSLGPPPRRYQDFLSFCAQADLKSGIAYFRELLAGKSAPTAVPLAEPLGRPLEGKGYGELEWVCSPEIAGATRALAQSTGSTVGTVIQAMFGLVLSRYTGETDVIFGSTRAGRGAFGPSAKEMMGLFINTVPLRVDLSDDTSVLSLIQALRSQTIQVRKHETIPLSQVFQASEMSPGSPLFETLLMFENRDFKDVLIEYGGQKWSDKKLHIYEQPALPLTLTVLDKEHITLRGIYDRKRLREESVRQLLASCERALQGLSKGGDTLLREIDVLPEAERQKILYTWNETSRPFSDQLLIHELFEARVTEQPDAPAVECRGQVLTYRQLEERANRIANTLIQQGVEPGRYVGVCLTRSLDLVCALLGIAKAGAAYVPLDPAYPEERLALMLADVEAALVIVDPTSAGAVHYSQLELGGAGESALELAAVERPARRTTPTTRCYTIFTSGSTGLPKGVVLTHRAVVNTLEWVNRTFEMSPADRLLFVTSPCFDLSVYDVFGMLGAGGTVVVASEDLLAAPEVLSEAIVSLGITVWDSAPAALGRLLPFLAGRGGPQLRICMLSGDWIPMYMPDAMRTEFPNCRVMSLGGATEAAIWSNWFPIRELNSRWVSIPYGKPIQNARYHILDRRMQPVPVGVTGDLYIGGVCLASGYHGREELTKERFVPDPFSDGPDQRLYKTGDLARYFPDGNMEFLGRSDFQVKIRGYRVEIGEVEAVLCQLDGVRVAVCTALGDASGQKSLIAYVVPLEGKVFTQEEIKEKVAVKLPSFMVPSRVMFLDSLPTTRNGKLDREALPDPNLQVEGAVIEPPQGAVEEELVRMWCKLLQRNEVGVTDHFFSIGGHSLLAVMLIARIKHRFDLDLPLATLLAHPTIRELAPHIENSTGLESATRHLHAFSRSGELSPLVLVPGVVGTAFTYRSLPAGLGPNQPIYVIDLLATNSTGAFPDTIEEMARMYIPEIEEECRGRTIVLGGFSFGALVAYEIALQLRQKGYKVPLIISFDGFAPGYPYSLPLPERLLAHARALLNDDRAARKGYLDDRRKRLGDRFQSVIKRPFLQAPPTESKDPHELRDHMDRVGAAQARAHRRYRPKVPRAGGLDVALLLLRAEEEPTWVGMKTDDPLHGWKRFVSGPISLITFPGSHMDIWNEEHRSLVTNAISDHIRRFASEPDELPPPSIRGQKPGVAPAPL